VWPGRSTLRKGAKDNGGFSAESIVPDEMVGNVGKRQIRLFLVKNKIQV